MTTPTQPKPTAQITAPKRSHWKVTLISASIAAAFFVGIIVNHWMFRR